VPRQLASVTALRSASLVMPAPSSREADPAFAAVTLAVAGLVRPSRRIWLGLGLAVAIVALQGLWLLPLLDAPPS
jgi:hypothetical protein